MKARHAAGSGCILLLLAIPAACQLLDRHGTDSARSEAVGILRTAASAVRYDMAADPAVNVPDSLAALRAARAHLPDQKIVTVTSSAGGFSVIARFDQNWYHSNQQHRVRLCVEYGATTTSPAAVRMVDAACPPDPSFQAGLDEFVKLDR
jgi:hypothetical protein